MTYPVIIRGLAERDLEEASGWYDLQRMGLGAEFLDAVTELIRRLAENPASYPVVNKETRRAVLRRFPYLFLHSRFNHRGPRMPAHEPFSPTS